MPIGDRIKAARIAKSRRIYAYLQAHDKCCLIPKARPENVFNQSHLAEACNTDQARVSEWERGIYEPRISSLRKLAKILKVSMSDLIGED